MTIFKPITVVAVLALGLLVAGCQKEDYESRDTSQLKPKPVDPGPPPDPTLVGFDNADTDENWEIVGPKAVEKTGRKEGEAYLKSSINNGEDYMHFIKRRPAIVDPKLTKETGQFLFWFYVSDPSLLKADGQIELTSSGESDKKEYAWSVASIIPTLRPGWNEVKLNFQAAEVSSDGGPDINAFNFFRIFFWTKDKAHADVQVGIDDLRFRARPLINESFDNADTDEQWEIVGPKAIEKAGRKEGEAWLKSTIVNNEDYMHFIKRRPTAVNAGLTAATGRLRFWFYVSDISLVKADGQIELTSSGESDKKEYAWNLAAIVPNLRSGWNELSLDFSAAEASADGGPDINAFNFFRIFFWTKDKAHADLVTGLDDIRLTEK
ncbi:MAG: hypothetical protein P0Y53_00915 [Candidatus Pseudobacter hemicellulosilyticus]|uniref:Uncharacterized protein n=1 Tax=Candidatus Pseudobacter hemicellulosilyticus TaxID=3121375 RepID=A0AAJ5WUU0_9BACT|nr:MAG: hypothetical protein P0Y53_00915 [Pseudobacter sp.]